MDSKLQQIGENEVLQDKPLSQPLVSIRPGTEAIIEEVDEGEISDDEFLKMMDEEEKNDTFNQDPSVEPNMEKRLSEEPALKKEDSYEYKLTELEFEFPKTDEIVSE
jgi:hypothetical protein